jgi:hypothetical protein
MRNRSACIRVSACALTLIVFIQSAAQRVEQTAEALDAYQVCRQFQKLLAEDLDFDRAFEATFTKDKSRRREVAIAEGEFGSLDLRRVDDASLIDAYKSRMQIFYLMMPLLSPGSAEQEVLFFPPAIKRAFDRKPPQTARAFRTYAIQLKRDAAYVRAHLQRLAGKHPNVAERIREFKEITLSSKELEPPDHLVQPLTAYSRGQVLPPDKPYYQIGSYAVIRENGEMRIIGIRFFLRLF